MSQNTNQRIRFRLRSVMAFMTGTSLLFAALSYVGLDGRGFVLAFLIFPAVALFAILCVSLCRFEV